MKNSYTILAKYYDLIHQDKDYCGEAEFIRTVVKRKAPNATSILDVGCGTGVHLNLLKHDFKLLYGIDKNSEILDEARKKSPKITYQLGGMADFKINHKFDVITCLYSVFNYNSTAKEAKKALKNIKSHLKPNGLAVFAIYTPHNTRKKVRLHIGRDDQAEIVKINQFEYDPQTRMEISNYFVLVKDKEKVDFFTETGHRYRIYQVDEFTKMLKATGFANVETFDNFTVKPASSKTKYPVIVTSLKRDSL